MYSISIAAATSALGSGWDIVSLESYREMLPIYILNKGRASMSQTVLHLPYARELLGAAVNVIPMVSNPDR